MALTLYWTSFAERKLEDIFAYYAVRAGFQIAQKLVSGIIEKTISLENNHLIGQKEPLLKSRNDEYRYLVYKSYKIIYRINKAKERIEVVHVFDCRQNPEKMIDL